MYQGDLVIVLEILESVLSDEGMRERVLGTMDLSDEEAKRVLEEVKSCLR